MAVSKGPPFFISLGRRGLSRLKYGEQVRDEKIFCKEMILGRNKIVWLAIDAPSDKTGLFWRDKKVIDW